jgi:hypothetical protein
MPIVKSYTCKAKGCGFSAPGPGPLGLHYKKFEGHRPSVGGGARPKAQAYHKHVNGHSQTPHVLHQADPVKNFHEKLEGMKIEIEIQIERDLNKINQLRAEIAECQENVNKLTEMLRSFPGHDTPTYQTAPLTTEQVA